MVSKFGKLAPRVEDLRIGPSLAPDAEMGPLITREHRDKVAGYVQGGADAGATVVVDGRGDGAVVLIADRADDAALLTRALAARAWLQARVSDWRKLAPELGLRAGASIRLPS